MKTDLLPGIITEILRNTPYRPFLCLPLSALLYVILKDKHNIKSNLVTGSLSFKDEIIFKQDFSIANADKDRLQYWRGHAWVEIEDMICDLSIFRTLYSSEFTKQCKDELIKTFGEGRGCLIATRYEMLEMGFNYQAIDHLEDKMATGIIKGFSKLLSS
jgi:hypothetical protein